MKLEELIKELEVLDQDKVVDGFGEPITSAHIKLWGLDNV